MSDTVIDVLKRAARDQAFKAIKARKQIQEYREAITIEQSDEAAALAAHAALETAILVRDRNTPDTLPTGRAWTIRGVNAEQEELAS